MSRFDRWERSHSLKREILGKYEEYADRYSREAAIMEFLGIGKIRRGLLRRAGGKVLDVAVGPGQNLRHYDGSCRVIAVDLSSRMLAIARRRGPNLNFARMDGESLAFSSDSFDTVVSSLVLCTFPDPASALAEMKRVCRPGGRILLLEHGRSDRRWLGKWQDRTADRYAGRFGCRWNREPLELVLAAGLLPVRARQMFFGIFHAIECRPGKR